MMKPAEMRARRGLTMLMMMTSVLLIMVGQVESSSSLVAVAGCDGRSDKKELQVRKKISLKTICFFINFSLLILSVY